RADPCRPMGGMWRPWRRRWTRHRSSWGWPSTSGPLRGCPPTWSSRPGSVSPPAGCGPSWPSAAGCVGGPNTPSTAGRTGLPSPPPAPSWRRWGKKVAAAPERYELHVQDETHLETNPYLCRTWHRRGHQPTLPAAGTNRRVTVCGSVEALGRGGGGLVRAAGGSGGVVRYLGLLGAHHPAAGAGPH